MTHASLASLFSDIADAIRGKTGGSTQLVADDFPTAIAGIPVGLEYETGTYTTTSNVAQPSISFSKTHTRPPVFLMMADTTQSTPANNSNMIFAWFDAYRAFGVPFYSYSSSYIYYSEVFYLYATSSGSVGSTYGHVSQRYSSDDDSTSSSSYAYYWVSNTRFRPYSSSSSHYWRSGRTYKWIAVWMSE